jgi:hypothetical protein
MVVDANLQCHNHVLRCVGCTVLFTNKCIHDDLHNWPLIGCHVMCSSMRTQVNFHLFVKKGLIVDPCRGTLLVTLVKSMIPIDDNPRFNFFHNMWLWRMCTRGLTLRLVCLMWSLVWLKTCVGMVYEKLCNCKVAPNIHFLRLDCTMCSEKCELLWVWLLTHLGGHEWSLEGEEKPHFDLV